MTEGNGFAPGFRLQDGADLNAALANPLWSISPDVIATQGGDVNTSFRLTNTISTITTSPAPNSGVVLPQALDGKICIVNNKGANSIKIFAAGGSTIDGTSGATGVTLGAGLGYLFAATNTNEWSIFDWNGGSTTGAVIIQGGWDAGANVPALTSGVGTQGFAYIVSNAGSTNLDGTTQWNVGDWAVFDGTIWTKLAGGVNSSTATSTAVASVAALRLLPVVVGAVVTLLGYYTAGDAPARTMYGVANPSPVDDGGMAFNGPTGNQWVSEAPNNGELNALWFGAVRNVSTAPATDSSPAFQAAINWINAGSLVGGPNRPVKLFAPVGIYRLNTGLNFGRVSLTGDGGQQVSNLNIHTQFYWYGAGWCMDFLQNAEISDFYVWGKNQTVWQNGIIHSGGVQGKIKNVMVYDLNMIGIQLYRSSFGNTLIEKFENVAAVNQLNVSGKIGICIGSSGLYNSNANVFDSVYVKGRWEVLFELCGNTNTYIGGVCEPVNQTPDLVKHWYLFRGQVSEVKGPYIETFNKSTLSATFKARYKPFKFSGLWRVVEFMNNPVAGETLLINGTTITFVASGAVGNQCNIGLTIQDTVLNLEALVNASADPGLTVLNAYPRYEEIVFDQRYKDPPASLTVTCTRPGAPSATVQITGSVITWTSNGFQNGDLVAFSTVPPAPGGGLVANLAYYIVNVTPNTFQVSLTRGGTPVGTNATGQSYSAYVPCSFRLPVGVGANVWAGPSNSNRINRPLWNNNYWLDDFNCPTAAVIDDLGMGNDFIGTRTTDYAPMPTTEKISPQNQAPNALFVQTYVDGSGRTLPAGYYLTQFSAGCTINRISTNTPNGRGYAFEVFIPSGGRFELRFVPVYANLAAWGNGPYAIPQNMMINRTITCGMYVKSSVAGLGASSFLPGNAATSRTAHSGSGEWEPLVVSARVINTPTSPQSTALVISNNINFSPDISGGTIQIAEPFFYFGNKVPDVNLPRLIDDSDSAMVGRLSLNAPQGLLSSAGANNSTTPSVAEFNTFTEAYTSPVNVTQFLGGRAGQEITIFTTTANITFQHNGNNGIVAPNTIYMKGGANVPTVANRMYTFMFNGTKWYETTNDLLTSPSRTFATLPAANSVPVGTRLFITDSNTATFGNAAAGGGANAVPVFTDGTAWKVG